MRQRSPTTINTNIKDLIANKPGMKMSMTNMIPITKRNSEITQKILTPLQ